MSLQNVLGFEMFNLKDMLGKVKDDPLAAVLGGLDPAGAELWKGLGVLDKDFEPAVNIFGGPMGGGTTGLDKEGGVFGRATDAGIDTGLSAESHRIAEQIAAAYAMAYGGGQVGGLMGGEQGAAFGSELAPQLPGLLDGGQPQPMNNTAHAQAVARERQKRSLLGGYRV